MKISIEDDKKSVVVTCPDDSNIDEVLLNIHGALIAYGFHADTVLEGLMRLKDYDAVSLTKEDG